MKPTVHDIAAAAGVSLATVDRVLNRRSGVREVTREKVESVIRDLGYVRDVAAANLAKRRVYPLVFIIPDSASSFMRRINREVREAASRAAIERTDISWIEVPAFEVAPLVRTLHRLAEERPAGVALVAVDAPEVRDAVDKLVAMGIPVVTLVSDLPGSKRHHYAGIDNLAAGRTAAHLLGRFLQPRTSAEGQSIAVLAGSMLVRDHRERLEGFRSLLASDFPSLEVLPVLEGRDDPAQVHEILLELFQRHADIAGLYSVGAGNRGLIRALKEQRGAALRAVIAHELTEHTRDALLDGTIDVILNQDAGHEVRSAIRVLKARADELAVIDAQERIRLDIFIKENLP